MFQLGIYKLSYIFLAKNHDRRFSTTLKNILLNLSFIEWKWYKKYFE